MQEYGDGRNVYWNLEQTALDTRHGVAVQLSSCCPVAVQLLSSCCPVAVQLLSSCCPVVVQFEPTNLSSSILPGIRSRMRWAGHVAHGELRKPCKIVAGWYEVCQEFTVGGRILLKLVLGN